MDIGKEKLSQEDCLVFSEVEAHLLEQHQLCGVSEVAELTGLPQHRCRNILEGLVGKEKLYRAYSAPGKPHLYLPRYMMDELLRMQRKPDWLAKYELPEKKSKVEQLEEARKEIHRYERFERMLYATGIPLEESVADALKWLGFPDVEHITLDKDNPDFRFYYKGIRYVGDSTGKRGPAIKDDVTQLDGWRQAEVTSANADPDKIRAILVVNHHRDKDPAERDDPLTQHARKFMKMYKFILLTTPYLFSLCEEVIVGRLTKKEARNRIIQGEPIDETTA